MMNINIVINIEYYHHNMKNVKFLIELIISLEILF